MTKYLRIILIVLCTAGVSYAGKQIPNGSTSQSISVVIQDADGDPNASVTITDLDLYIQIDGAGEQSTKVDLTELATASTAWDDYKAYHVGNGLVRVDIPDANLSDGDGTNLTYIIVDGATSNRTAYYEVQLRDTETGTNSAALATTALTDATWTNALATILAEIHLSAIGDTVQVVMDANSLLVNLTAARAGYLDNINNARLTELGLSEISSTVREDMDANSILADWEDGGRLDLILDTIDTNAAMAASGVTGGSVGRYAELNSFMRPEPQYVWPAIYRKPRIKGDRL